LALRELTEEQTIDVITPRLPDLHRDDLVLLARLARGCPGRALDLAAAGGADTYRAMMSLLSTLPDMDQSKALALADQFAGARAGDAFYTFAELYLAWLRRLVRDAALAGEPQNGDDPTGRQGGIDPVETMLNQKLAALGPNRWLAVWETARDQIAKCKGLNLDTHSIAMTLFFDLDSAARLH